MAGIKIVVSDVFAIAFLMLIVPPGFVASVRTAVECRSAKRSV